MGKRLFDVNPMTGTIQYYEMDPDGNKIIITEVTDTTPLLDDNKRRQNDGTGGWNADKSMRHAAHIPNAVCEMWRTQLGVNVLDPNDWPRVKQLLNSSEWMWLRTANWQI
jgi:hypothetical protein